MNSREIVFRTLDFTRPDRVARSFGDSDFVGALYKTRTRETDWKSVGAGRSEKTDEWGNTWGRIDRTSKGEVIRGVLDDLSDVDSLELPDFSKPSDYDSARKTRDDHPSHFLIGGMPGFAFNIARKMRKMERYLADLLVEPEAMARLHDRIDVQLEAMIRNYAAAGVDGVMFCEDWGTQSQTLIHPDLWHGEFFPRFVRLCGLAHERGVRVLMHSCGQVGAIVPGLMEAGIDLLQFDQPDLHGIDVLAAYQERQEIAFWCPVDIQRTLQTRDETIIRAKAREMIDKLWRGRGGFVAGFYVDEPSIGLEPRWQAIACDEFVKYGVQSTVAPATPQKR